MKRGGAFTDYPALNKPGWEKQVTAKAEFHPRRHTESCDNQNYRLQNAQQFARNFLAPGTPYKSLLLFHGVGVGKTCAAVHVAEQYLTDNKAIMIVPEQIQSGFRKSIYDAGKVPIENNVLDVASGARYQCTGTRYANQEMNSNEQFDLNDLSNRMKVRIGLRYKFMGERAFGNEVTNLVNSIRDRFSNSDEESVEKEIQYSIKEEYDNRVFVIDEAHELRQDGEKKESYLNLVKVLTICNNIRLLLLTATPMYHNASEIVDLVNLMRANENLPLLSKNAVFRTVNDVDTLARPKDLVDAIQGRVSFVAGENPRTFPVKLPPDSSQNTGWIQAKKTFQNQPFKGKHEKNDLYKYIVSSELSAAQVKAYGATPPGKLQALQQISNVAFFPETFDNKDDAIRKAYIIKRSTDSDMRFKYRGTRYMSPSNIRKHAPKIAAVVASVLECIHKTDGLCFVYSNFIDFGTEQLAIAFEEHGIGPYGNTKTRLVDAPSTAAGPYKYMIVTKEDRAGSSFSTQKKVDLINNEQKNVRVIIGSQYASQGLDFKRIREVHVLDPWWNVSRLNQVVGRAVRRCSHFSLPELHRNTTVYFHCSVLPRAPKESVDQYMYRRAFNQNKEILKIERLLAEHAIDCDLNKAEPAKAFKTLNSKAKSVTVPKAQRPAGPACRIRWPAVGTDRSTVHPYQYSALIDVLAWEVRDYMIAKTVATFEDILEGTGDPPALLLALTLERLMDPLQGERWLAPYGRISYRGKLYILLTRELENKPFTFQEVVSGSLAAPPSIDLEKIN